MEINFQKTENLLIVSSRITSSVKHPQWLFVQLIQIWLLDCISKAFRQIYVFIIHFTSQSGSVQWCFDKCKIWNQIITKIQIFKTAVLLIWTSVFQRKKWRHFDNTDFTWKRSITFGKIVSEHFSNSLYWNELRIFNWIQMYIEFEWFLEKNSQYLYTENSSPPLTFESYLKYSFPTKIINGLVKPS